MEQRNGVHDDRYERDGHLLERRVHVRVQQRLSQLRRGVRQQHVPELVRKLVHRVFGAARERERDLQRHLVRLFVHFRALGLQRVELRRMRVRHACLLRHVVRDDAQQWAR
jgi:hypothetical protein